MINAIVTIKSGYNEIKFGFQFINSANNFAISAREHLMKIIEDGKPVKSSVTLEYIEQPEDELVEESNE